MSCKPEQNSRLSLTGMDEAVERIRKSAADGLVLFLGAGISKAPPSDCPIWNELLELAMLSAQKAHAGLGRYCDMAGPQLTSLKPELLCQVLYNNTLGDFFGFIDVLYMGQPNANHYSIANMTDKYTIPLILTTNFDVYIEETLSLMGSHRLHVGSAPRRLRDSLKSVASLKGETHVVKVHGSLDDRASIVLTLRQAGLKLKDDLADIIGNALAYHTVLVVGYSGNDDDVFPVFMNSAAEAKNVFWVLWEDKQSITPNIRAFDKACPNCSLVAADKMDILQRLVDHHGNAKPSNSANEMEFRQREFLLRWAAGIDEHHWRNFFSELLLLMGCADDVAHFIAEESEVTIRTATDPWAVTRALNNRARALIMLQDWASAQEAISRAADNYMHWGHHREVIECLTTMITRIPQEGKWRGDDPLFWCAQLSGKTYDPYGLGLYNYAAGIHFLKQQRLDLAKTHLLVGGGYAKRCGDSVTQVSCIEGLAEICGMDNDGARQQLCRQEIARIKNVLGVCQSSLTMTEGRIVQDCEDAAKRDVRRSVVGESVIVLTISLVLGAVACIFIHEFWPRFGTFVGILLAGAAVKIWNVKKRFIKYRHIDRY